MIRKLSIDYFAYPREKSYLYTTIAVIGYSDDNPYIINIDPTNMKHIIIGLLLAACAIPAGAQVEISEQATASTDFPLYDGGKSCEIYVDPEDFEVVKKTATLFAEDLGRVTGKNGHVTIGDKPGKGKNIVIMGTLGHNRFIDELVKQKRLDVSAIKHGWEQYTLKTIERPAKGIDRALVVVGCDRRGTAYGAFALSEAMGVSPLYWWADVPVKRKKNVYVKALDYTSKAPSVKYRGIFINDEGWGITPWASKTFDKELGDIGPKTYGKVCELILRMKGNMLAPAMHPSSGAFHKYPANKLVADSFAIVMTSSHCEPLQFNNVTEWNQETMGEWNYMTNKEGINKELDKRVSNTAPYENFYTLAMRGIHDAGLVGVPKGKEVSLIEEVLDDQRAILSKYINHPIDSIPQQFVPYKEVMEIYERGLRVPDDVTLVWVDDNYGYMKRLSNPQEQQRKGRSGVYYHTSYLGAPHDYLWICTTPPVLMYEELKKAYDTGADRYWLLNVGDIKPAELAIKTFFDMAWDIDLYDIHTINNHQATFLSQLFGEDLKPRFQHMLDEYYRLAWSRKPEFMGWEREWDAPEYSELTSTDYSFQHYNDALRRLDDYKRLSDEANTLLQALPAESRPAFFELLGYQAMASYQMNRKFLLAQLCREKQAEGKTEEANWAATQSKMAYDSIASLNHRYNTQLDGKWNHMMTLAPGWVAKYQNMPELPYTQGKGETPVDLTLRPEQDKLERCALVNLADFQVKSSSGHTLRLVKGLGYDWQVLQLGEALEALTDPTSPSAPSVEYQLPKVDADSVTIHVYTLPFFPIYKGRSTSYGVSVDGAPVQVANNLPKEFSKEWKDHVLQNGVEATFTFPVDRLKEGHTLTFTCGDPGVMIQRVILDWGGLKKTYVGSDIRITRTLPGT